MNQPPSLSNAPDQLVYWIHEFFEKDQWINAANIAWFESGWRSDATNDTRSPDHPCGSIIGERDGVQISAEWSIGYFQINACQVPADWDPERLYIPRENVGTANDLFVRRGWTPWYFSAKQLGLI